MVFATPHLLTYDLVLLLVPLAWLRAPVTHERPEARVRLGVALYLAASASPLYYFTGFSLVPLVLAWGLFQLTLWRSATAYRFAR